MRYAILGILLTFVGSIVHGQSGVTTISATPPASRSFYVGRLVDHPESLSGVWEASDGQGGAVGIHLHLMTAVTLHVNLPIWTPQSWVRLEVSVFQRKGSGFASGDEKYFIDSPDGASVTLQDGHLRVHFVSNRMKLPSIDLDLVRQQDNCWHGRLHRRDFDSVVSLCRPTSSVGDTGSALVGTWTDNKLGCMHIFANGEGGFTGWSDVLQVPGRIPFNPKGSGPQTLLQQYGSLLKIKREVDNFWGIGFYGFDGHCCSQHILGLLSNDGSKLASGLVSDGGVQVGLGRTWTKLSGDSCVTNATLGEATARRNE
jgi:hypothetical protein